MQGSGAQLDSAEIEQISHRHLCAIEWLDSCWASIDDRATMAHELMVGLTVTDDVIYQQYRDAMAPLLARHGGGFRYDFTIGKVLKSASDHPINRVFAIYFGSLAQKDAFFAHPDYLAIKAKFFQRAVVGTTILGAYDR